MKQIKKVIFEQREEDSHRSITMVEGLETAEPSNTPTWDRATSNAKEEAVTLTTIFAKSAISGAKISGWVLSVVIGFIIGWVFIVPNISRNLMVGLVIAGSLYLILTCYKRYKK